MNSEIYSNEFNLNLDHQLKKINEIIQVGYVIDDLLLFTVIIPKKLLDNELR